MRFDLVLDYHLNPAILRSTSRTVCPIWIGIRDDKVTLAIPLCRDPLVADTRILKRTRHGLGPPLGELLIVGVAANGIGVSFDRYPTSLGLIAQHTSNVASLGPCVTREVSLTKLEEHIRQIDDHAAFCLARLDILSLELFQEFTVTGEFLPLLLNLPLLFFGNLVPLLQ